MFLIANRQGPAWLPISSGLRDLTKPTKLVIRVIPANANAMSRQYFLLMVFISEIYIWQQHQTPLSVIKPSKKLQSMFNCAQIPSPNSAKVALIEPPSKENNGENIDAIRRNCAIISPSFISTPADTVCRTKILPLVPDYWGLGVEIGGRGLEQNLKREKVWVYEKSCFWITL